MSFKIFLTGLLLFSLIIIPLLGEKDFNPPFPFKAIVIVPVIIGFITMFTSALLMIWGY